MEYNFIQVNVNSYCIPNQEQCPRRFLGIIGQNPSVSKSNWLHVVIFQFFFIDLRYIL